MRLCGSGGWRLCNAIHQWDLHRTHADRTRSAATKEAPSHGTWTTEFRQVQRNPPFLNYPTPSQRKWLGGPKAARKRPRSKEADPSMSLTQGSVGISHLDSAVDQNGLPSNPTPLVNDLLCHLSAIATDAAKAFFGSF